MIIKPIKLHSQINDKIIINTYIVNACLLVEIDKHTKSIVIAERSLNLSSF